MFRSFVALAEVMCVELPEMPGVTGAIPPAEREAGRQANRSKTCRGSVRLARCQPRVCQARQLPDADVIITGCWRGWHDIKKPNVEI